MVNGDGEMSYKKLLEEIRRNTDPNSRSVLLVDDERGIRKKVARDVRQSDPDLAVFEAGNGREAIKKLAEIRKKFYRDPVLIVCDLQMPVMDGWEFIEWLKKDYESQGKQAGIPVIILSSTSGEKSAGFLRRKSVHDGKSGYEPLITVAKESCVDRGRYDTAGKKGLDSWIEHFVSG